MLLARTFTKTLLVLAVLIPASPAHASVLVAYDARGGNLRVDATGDAEASWVGPDGARRSIVVRRDGALEINGSLRRADVSTPAPINTVPIARVVRRTADGSLYALQAWQRLPNGPIELRFSRWQGAEPTFAVQGAFRKQSRSRGWAPVGRGSAGSVASGVCDGR